MFFLNSKSGLGLKGMDFFRYRLVPPPDHSSDHKYIEQHSIPVYLKQVTLKFMHLLS